MKNIEQRILCYEVWDIVLYLRNKVKEQSWRKENLTTVCITGDNSLSHFDEGQVLLEKLKLWKLLMHE